MYKNMLKSGNEYSLLGIIVNRGKGSRVLEFAYAHGVSNASCLMGKGTIQNKVLQLLEMDEVDKEIILMAVPFVEENDFLKKLNHTFQFDRQNSGIAFTMPMAGQLVPQEEASMQWDHRFMSIESHSDYGILLLIVDKGSEDKVIEVSQKAGYYGGTVIKAHGSIDDAHELLNMTIHPEKQVILMVMKTDQAHQLAALFKDPSNPNPINPDLMMMLGVRNVLGLYDGNNHAGRNSLE